MVEDEAKGLGQMAEWERDGISGCGWLLIISGVFALGLVALAWLVKLEVDEAGGGVAAVWVTASGTRYHRRDCPALARSTPELTTLDRAKADGLRPCDLCGPPA